MRIDELIKQRKDQLDVEQAPPDLWNNIKDEWRQTPKQPFQWWKAAAIVFITFSVGLLIHNVSLQRQVDELASLGDISEEYQSLEKNYIQQVNQLEANLPLAEARTEEDYQWLFEELNTLDEINEVYRADIGKIDEEALVEVLIDYYEKKIRLLKKLELEIERTKRTKNEKNTTDSVSI